jgi:AraC family transcriptional regulator
MNPPPARIPPSGDGRGVLIGVGARIDAADHPVRANCCAHSPLPIAAAAAAARPTEDLAMNTTGQRPSEPREWQPPALPCALAGTPAGPQAGMPRADRIDASGVTPPAEVRRRGLNRRALTRALAYIEAHLGEEISLGDLAGAAAISRFHFARLFRASTGHSPMAFLLRLRIARAQDMLHAGNRRIAEIAAALGFFDQSHFARTFRRLTGQSPREYARRGPHRDAEAA